jgi:hypothetical protein
MLDYLKEKEPFKSRKFLQEVAISAIDEVAMQVGNDKEKVKAKLLEVIHGEFYWKQILLKKLKERKVKARPLVIKRISHRSGCILQEENVDVSAPEILAAEYCISKDKKNNTHICFFQLIGKKKVCVARLILNKKLSTRLGHALWKMSMES